MTFATGLWQIDGNVFNGIVSRIMAEAATSEQQGIVDPLDLIVRATATPSPGITLDAGSCVINGLETANQGSYIGYNVGLDSTLTIAATGGTGRSDMIVARAEDPTWSGSPWTGDPAAQVVFPRVISGVSGSATSPPAGMSQIPLARIDIPASTTNITNAMIVDLRSVARPHSQKSVLSLQGTTWSSPSNSPVASGPTLWPNPSGITVAVPSWATFLTVWFTLAGVAFTPGGSGNTAADGTIKPILLGTGTISAPAVSGPTAQYHAYSTEASGSRRSLFGGGTVAIPASLRGTTTTLEFSATGTSLFNGFLVADLGTSIVVDLTWQQLASQS